MEQRVIVSCPNCKQKYRLPVGKVGIVKCTKCAKSFEADTRKSGNIECNDEDLYLKATQEVSSSGRNDALWAKANAIADGNLEKTKYTYIKLRVEQLKKFHQQKTEVPHSNRSTGALILELTQDFSLYENCFIYKGVSFPYERVSSIYHNAWSVSVNFFGNGSVSMSIALDEKKDQDHIISFSKDYTLFKSKFFKNISVAADIVSKKTFSNRLSRYLNKLKTQGFISIKKIDIKNWDTLEGEEWEVRIYENGDVTEKDIKFNLKNAYKNKSLQIGYSAHLGYEGKTDPYEVIVSESGTSFWNKKIKFNISTDYDVMVTILKSLAGIQ